MMPDPAPAPAPAPVVTPPAERPPARLTPRLLVLLAGLTVVLVIALWSVMARGGSYHALTVVAADTSGTPSELNERLASLAPRGVYVFVDTYQNRLRVFRDGELLRDAICSSGSRTTLRDPKTGREWIFDTPLGERRVERKTRDPVWFKPDWAFIEEGFEPPPMGTSARVDDISLGEYGLYLGDGYIIHGTLFQTLLGQPLTHGCIRLGDADLEYVYKTVPKGARVYLY